MSGKKQKKGGHASYAVNAILILANVAVLVLLCVSGFSQILNPKYHNWLVSLSLFFPVFLAACSAFAVFWIFRKRKYLLVSLVGLLICFSPIRTYFPLNFKQDVPRGSLKILTYNVQAFNMADSAKFRAIVDYIETSNADLVFLQESPYQNDKKEGRTVDSTMTAQWAYADTIHFGKYNGIGIYSKFPILSTRTIKGGDESHGSMICQIKIGADTIYAINCHYPSNRMEQKDKKMFKLMVKEPEFDSTQIKSRYLMGKIDSAGVLRANQVDSIIQILDQLGDVPIIFCGDFNDSPLSYVHYQLTKKLNDAYTRTGNGPGISYHEAGMYFRLDNILCSSHWKPYRAKVDTSIRASDHYPLFCWLKLDKN